MLHSNYIGSSRQLQLQVPMATGGFSEWMSTPAGAYSHAELAVASGESHRLPDGVPTDGREATIKLMQESGNHGSRTVTTTE